MKIPKITLGVLCCLLALVLLSYNILILGLPLFILGFLLMNGFRWPWQRR